MFIAFATGPKVLKCTVVFLFFYFFKTVFREEKYLSIQN